METVLLFYLLLFLVAFLYASVGHGGASGYLALMALFSIAPDVMKPTALLLNLLFRQCHLSNITAADILNGICSGPSH